MRAISLAWCARFLLGLCASSSTVKIDQSAIQGLGFVGLKKGDKILYGDMVGTDARGKPMLTDELATFLVQAHPRKFLAGFPLWLCVTSVLLGSEYCVLGPDLQGKLGAPEPEAQEIASLMKSRHGIHTALHLKQKEPTACASTHGSSAYDPKPCEAALKAMVSAERSNYPHFPFIVIRPD
jgi:hypothetical protein